MKLLKFLFLAVITVSLTACGDDDGPAAFELVNANVAGAYDVVFFESTGTQTTQFNGAPVVNGTQKSVYDSFTNATFTFTEAGTFSSTGGFRSTVTTTPANMPATVTSFVDNFDDVNESYSVNSASKTITLYGDVVGDVTLFNNTNLRFINESVEVEDGVTTTIVSEIRLVRQ